MRPNLLPLFLATLITLSMVALLPRNVGAEPPTQTGDARMVFTRVSMVKSVGPSYTYVFGSLSQVGSGLFKGAGIGSGGATIKYVYSLDYLSGIDRGFVRFNVVWSVVESSASVDVSVSYSSKERSNVPLYDAEINLRGKGSKTFKVDVTQYLLIGPPPLGETDKKVTVTIRFEYSSTIGAALVTFRASPMDLVVVQKPYPSQTHVMYLNPLNDSEVYHDFVLHRLSYTTSVWPKQVVSIYFPSQFDLVGLYRGDGAKIDLGDWSIGKTTGAKEGFRGYSNVNFTYISKVNPFGASVNNLKLLLRLKLANYIVDYGVRTLLNQTNVVWEAGETFVLYSASILNKTEYRILDAAGNTWAWGLLTYRETRKVRGTEINIFYDNFTLNDVKNPGKWTIELLSSDDRNIGYRALRIKVYKPTLSASVSASSNVEISGSGYAAGGERWVGGEVFLVDPTRLVVEEDFYYDVVPGVSVTSVTMLNRVHGLRVIPRARVVVYNGVNRSITVDHMEVRVRVNGEVSTGRLMFRDIGEPDVFEGFETRAYLFAFGFFNETPLVRVYSGLTGMDVNVSMTPIKALRYYYRPKIISVEISIGEHSRELPFMLYDPWGVVRGKLIEYAPVDMSPTGSFNFKLTHINLYGSRQLSLYAIAYDNNSVTAIKLVYTESLDLSYSFDKKVISGVPGESQTVTITIKSLAKKMTLSFTIRLLYGSRDYTKARVIGEKRVTVRPGESIKVTISFKMPKPVPGVPAVLMVYSPELDRMFKWIDLEWKENMSLVVGGNTVVVPKLLSIQGLPTLELNLALIASMTIIILVAVIKVIIGLLRR